MRFFAVFSVFAVLVLAGCGSEEPLAPLPEGVQTLSGVLLPADISLIRRGSHVLRQNGQDVYYVESSVVNLRSYENALVTLRGVLARNVDSNHLPVLVAESLVDFERNTTEVTFDDFSFIATVPRAWSSVRRGQSTVLVGDDGIAVVTISWMDAAALEEGSATVIASKPARRLRNGSIETIRLPVNDQALQLRFAPESDDPELRDKWDQFLSSIHIISTSSSSSASSRPRTGTGSQFIPCGGPAGILCPSGSYCAITDFEENIGVCRGL